ncbi:MAG: hypothetical protein HRT81_15065, partial [Henriciella sp.]|nr:hypothetical protein [Henriciella sp.]
HGTLLPEWLPATTFIGPLALAALFVIFSIVKLRKVKRNRTAAEKLYRYAAIWTPLYATAWCFSLVSEYAGLRDAGFILAGLGVLGLIGVTTLREVYAVVEHPVGADWMKKVKRYDANPEATAVVQKAREVVLDVFNNHGAAHFQIGRTYPYKEGRDEATWKLVEAIKNAVDEKGIVNPGALGLG